MHFSVEIELLEKVGVKTDEIPFVKVRYGTTDDSNISLIPMGSQFDSLPPLLLTSGKKPGVGPFQTRTFDSYDFNIPDNNHPQFTGFGLNYADANQVSLGDRAPWGGWGHDGLQKSPHIKETLASGDLNLKQDLDDGFLGGFFSSVEAGLDYTHRHKTKTVEELDLFLKSATPPAVTRTVTSGSSGAPTTSSTSPATASRRWRWSRRSSATRKSPRRP